MDPNDKTQNKLKRRQIAQFFVLILHGLEGAKKWIDR